MINKYSTSIHWSEEDQEFVATCTEFPYLSGIGETKEEALNILNEAVEVGIEMLEEDNEPVPLPIAIPECSGQIRLRMAKSLHKSLKEQAEIEGISLNQYLNYLLTLKDKEHEIKQIIESFKEVQLSVTHTHRHMISQEKSVEKVVFKAAENDTMKFLGPENAEEM